MKKKKTKKILILIIIIIILVLGSSFIIYFITEPKVSFKKKTFEFEYGSELKLENKDILIADKDILKTVKLNLENIKYETGSTYPKVGKYNVELSYKIKNKTKKENIKVWIKDTTKPVIEKIKDIQFEEGTKIDYKDYFKVTDLSSVTLEFDDSLVKYDEEGSYKVKVKAIDTYNNIKEEEVDVKIVKKQVKKTSVTTPYYVKGILIVNKKYKLPDGYAPGENKEAGIAVRNLIADMQALGLNVDSSYSGYRSYELQQKLYNNYVAKDGKEAADTYSARPGHSEHQTGLAFDLRHRDGSLITSSDEVKWVRENAHNYGFIVRYLEGKENITGYMAEPWHIRYVGSEATAIKNSGKTLEEYLEVLGGDYN